MYATEISKEESMLLANRVNVEGSEKYSNTYYSF